MDPQSKITISKKQRFEFQIAAEKIIIDSWVKDEEYQKIHGYGGTSSRVLADDIVNMVLDALEGKRNAPSGDKLKPWLAFGVKRK